jgi:hypothetical protein
LPSLRNLPDLDWLEDAGLLGRAPLPEELRSALGIIDDTDGNTFTIDVEDEPSQRSDE